jgi:SAM-dependent methyltransferase
MADKANRLHLGCGRTILPGWINHDLARGPGVDMVADLDACATTPLSLESDSVDEIRASHVLEHIRNPLALMQEIHRVARAGCKAVFDTPYGSSDDAFEDPTHARPYFLNSYGYFAQPCYWRADYGYRGDWQVEEVILKVSKARYEGKPAEHILGEAMNQRNVVLEMTAVLVAIKPVREARRELIVAPKIRIGLT